jgi:pilus assembly protein CpaF
MSIKHYKAGATIFAKGQPSDAAYILQSGQVELSDGTLLEPGGVLGIDDLFHQQPHSYSATAKQDCSFEVLSVDRLDELAAGSPPEIQKILEGLLHRPAQQQKDEGTSGAIGVNDRFATVLDRLTDFLSGSKAEDEAPVPTATAGINRKFFEEMEETKPIRHLLVDENINDILINGHKDVFIERHGKLEKTNVTFASDKDVYKLAEKIVMLVGRKLNRHRPLIDARLQDGSRVNIIAPPLAVDGTSVSIRKFPTRRLTLDIMREQKNISPAVCEFLKIVARCRINTLVSGGTGSGKTTLLNAMVDHIDHTERLVTIEDAVELRPHQPDVVRLETRPTTAGIKASEQVTMRDLVRNALRMRPDRIIVGEVRGEEAFDMLQAMNTGHEGSLTTIHANHPRDGLSRLENMVSMANVNLPNKALRYQIASALQVVIQVSRMRDGHRRITHVSEIVGMEGEMVTMHDLFNFVVEREDDKGNLSGTFKWAGIMPRFVRRIAYYGELKHLEDALGVALPKNL